VQDKRREGEAFKLIVKIGAKKVYSKVVGVVKGNGMIFLKTLTSFSAILYYQTNPDKELVWTHQLRGIYPSNT
jgi:hypothetical protein